MSWRTTKIDTSQFDKLISDFTTQNVNSRIISPDSLVDLYLKEFNISMSDEDKDMLTNVFSLLPPDLRRVADTETGSVNLISRVNVLAFIKQVAKHVSSTEKNSQARKTTLDQLTVLESTIVDGYASLEANSMETMDENGNVVPAGESVDEIKKVVQQPNYLPPQGRYASSSDTASGTTDSGTPIIDSSVPGLEQRLSEAVGQAETWEDYLRARPDSSILNLIDMEMPDALTVDDFESWVTSGRPTPTAPKKNYWGQKLSQDTIISATSGDKKITWNARQAVNYIYDLNEKGDTTKLREIQEMMFQAGYFRPETGLPIYGVLDQATTQAWNMWLTDAARENRSLKDHFFKTVQQNRDIRSGKLKIDPMEDPLAVTATFQSAAQDLLGRNLTDVELRLLSSKFDEWRREVLTYGLSPQDQPFDLESRVTAYLSERNNDEIWAGQKMELDSFVKEWIRG